jgi:hypothetical protein
MKIPKVPTSTDNVLINAVRDLVLQNHRLTIRETDEDVGISFGSCQAIMTEKLNMHRVAAKFVPRVLTEDQKANRVNISQELLDRVGVDENFLKTIVTGDETFILFPKLKPTLKGCRFDTFDEIQKNSTKDLFAIPNEAFQKVFQIWQKRWERCVASKGNYFEGDKLE